MIQSFHNQALKFTYRIRRNLKEADKARNQPLMLVRDAFMGDNTGVITTYQGEELGPGYVVVRDYDGNLSVAYNQRGVPQIPGIGIKVGYDPLQPNLFQVLSASEYALRPPAPGISPHHRTHEFPGSDTVFANSYQIVPGLLYVNGTWTAVIYPMYFRKLDGSQGYVAEQTVDFSSYVPSSGARAVTVVHDDDGVISVLPGAVVGGIGLLSLADFPVGEYNHTKMWGVSLFFGQENLSYVNTYDFRTGAGSSLSWGQIGGDINNQADLVTFFSTPTVGTYRLVADGVTTSFPLVDVLSELQNVFDNSLLVDPLEVGLSSDGTEVIFGTAPTAGHVLVVNGIVRSV